MKSALATALVTLLLLSAGGVAAIGKNKPVVRDESHVTHVSKSMWQTGRRQALRPLTFW